MSGRTFLLASALLLMFVGCSSSNEPAAVADTGEAQDTAPVEDTAPWLTYPEGPYGLEKDMVFPNAKFFGYRNGKESKDLGEWTEMSMQDYYDPTGERGVYALLVVVSAEWCGPCKEEAKDLPVFYSSLYQPRGARFLTAMIEDKNGQPAEQPVVDRWVNAYGTNFDIVADPGGETMLEKSDPNWSIPRNYIVNPRDMRIYRVNMGTRLDATNVPGLKTILDYNGAPAGPTSLDSGTTG
jgi:thiol-disulfide isomerase/thioredoxin